MNINKKPSFFRQIKKITDPALMAQLEQAILSVINAQSPKDIPELKKMKGYKSGIFYRIKIGNYRIGVTIENDTITFVAFGRRKDFYKFFP